MSLPNSNWNFPTRMLFGNGRIAELPEICRELNIQRPLLVTDEGLATMDFVSGCRERLSQDNINCSFYGGVQGNPNSGHVEAGCALFREHDCDAVIALGGGSALDAGKTIALVAVQSLSPWVLEDGDASGQIDPANIVPIIAIPTTAGTGSEVGRATVILDESAHRKRVLFHPLLLPTVVISDPELTRGLPPSITAWTGVDALVHSLEAFCAPGFHPMADGIAVEAIRIVTHWLPLAVSDGNDLEARGQMLTAASMGATAFQKGLGSIHSVSHVMSAFYNTHHGLANAIILPYGLVQNAPYIDERMAYLCRVLGLGQHNTTAMVDHLLAFRTSLQIPHTLAEVDIPDKASEDIGERALLDPCTPTNAKPVNANDLAALFRAAQTGDFELLSS